MSRGKKLLQMSVSAGLIALLLGYLDFSEAARILSSISPAPLLAVLAVYVLDRVLMAWKWGMLLSAVSIRPGLLELSRIYYISNFQGFAIPFGIGPDLVRLLKLSRHPRSDVLSSIVMERLLGLAASTAMAAVSAVVFLGMASGRAGLGIPGWAAGAGLALLAAGLWPLAAGDPEKILHKVPGAGRLLDGERAKRYLESFSKYGRNRRTLALFLGASFLEQLAPVFSMYFLARALSLPLGLAECLAFVPLGIFLQRLPVSFLGIGVREGSYVLLLGYLGVGYGDALVLGFMDLFMDLVFLVPAGVWALRGEEEVPAAAGKTAE
jgi:uncharacterized membrane protein YbhN (UPF0104 family)